MKRAAVAVSTLVWALTAVCGGPVATASADPVIAGAGDIACSGSPCSSNYATANLLAGSNAVYTVGDNQYSSGSLTDFTDSYDKTWGQYKSITRPSPGNHDPWGESGYDEYFGVPRYYAWNIGAWRLYALDSDTGPDSQQINWLRSDLAANPRRCVAAYWHHPRFSSASHGSDTEMAPFWDVLYAAGTDLVLTGHDHTYERFAPQNPSGQPDGAYGIREFVVGTGGKSHYGFDAPIANSQVRNDDTFGVLKLTLHATSYSWQFVPEAGKTFTDSGGRTCSAGTPPPSDTQAPSAPTNLTATAPSSISAGLTWGASTDNVGITGYEIFRSGTLLTTVTGTSHADTTVSPDTTYTYKVRARDAAGNRSAFSNSTTVTTPTSTTLAFAPTSDARVVEAAPTTNFGTSQLRVDGDGDRVESYLRFSLSGVSATVTSARLRVYAYSGTVDGPAVYRAGSAWTEAGITWSNRPGLSSIAADDKGSIGANTWVAYDVKRFILGDGTYSFALVPTSADAVDMYSREATSLRPRLVVSFG